MRKILIIAAPILIVALAAGAIFAMSALRPKPEEAAEVSKGLAVFTEPASVQDVSLTVSAQGEVTPRREIELVPEVSGKLVYVDPSFTEGGFFQQGDILMRVDDTNYRLAVTRARAAVAEAEQALTREQAEADLARAEWEDLGEGEASPLTLRKPQLAQAEAALASARAMLEEAQVNLGRTEIRAPFDGRVRTKMADIGQYVSPGQSLGRIFSTDTVEVRLPLTDAQLALMNLPLAFESSKSNPGPQVRFSTNIAGGVHEWTGRIVRTASVIDPQTRVLYAIAEVDDPYGEGADEGMPMAVGLFVDAAVEGRRLENAVIIPREALRNGEEVFVVNENDALDIRRPRVIHSNPENAILAGGVKDGEQVVVSPIQTPTQGLRLEPLPVEGADDPDQKQEEEDRAGDVSIASATDGEPS